MRGGDLHAVELGRGGDRSSLAVTRDDLFDLVGVERARLHVKARRGHRGGGDGRLPRGRHDLLAPAVEELHEQTGPVGVDGVGHPGERGHCDVVEHRKRLSRQQPGGVYGGGL